MMNVVQRAGIVGLFIRWAGGLRFPYLVGLTAGLFALDLVVPDFIPFADELLLGLATLVLGSFRKKVKDKRKSDLSDGSD